MSVFDQPDSPHLPQVVREYTRARRALFAANCGTDFFLIGSAAMQYRSAEAAMREDVAKRGGRWEVGRLVYKLDEQGLWIEQAPVAEPV